MMSAAAKVEQLKQVVDDCESAYQKAIAHHESAGTRASAENLRETKSELTLARQALRRFEAEAAAEQAA